MYIIGAWDLRAAEGTDETIPAGMSLAWRATAAV